MSLPCKPRYRPKALLAAVALTAAVLLGSPGKADAQYGAPNTYVCQCQGFWCVFAWTTGVPDGSPCYCNTMWGAVWGYSIDVSKVGRLPEGMPDPQSPDPSRPPPRADPADVDVGDTDCYRGLGNCAGSFQTAVSLGRVADAPGQRSGRAATNRPRSSSRFADDLHFLIREATADFRGLDAEFDDVTSRGTRVYYVYDTPDSYDRCRLYRWSRGGSSVVCRAARQRYRSALRQVTDALGDPDDWSVDESEWTVNRVEVDLEDDDGEVVILRIRSPR